MSLRQRPQARSASDVNLEASMNLDEQPVCGRDSRVAWLVNQLNGFLSSPHADQVGTKSVVSWYFNYGLLSMGLNRRELEAGLRPYRSLHELAMGLTDDEISQGMPPPEFGKGDKVEVVVNAKNTVPHVGSVIEFAWHPKDRKWLFTMEENGKKIGKRYAKEDLRLLLGS